MDKHYLKFPMFGGTDVFCKRVYGNEYDPLVITMCTFLMVGRDMSCYFC